MHTRSSSQEIASVQHLGRRNHLMILSVRQQASVPTTHRSMASAVARALTRCLNHSPLLAKDLCFRVLLIRSAASRTEATTAKDGSPTRQGRPMIRLVFSLHLQSLSATPQCNAHRQRSLRRVSSTGTPSKRFRTLSTSIQPTSVLRSLTTCAIYKMSASSTSRRGGRRCRGLACHGAWSCRLR